MQDLVNNGSPRTLKGRLDLGFTADDSGVTRMAKCYRTGLFHLSKPYQDHDQLVVQLVNPTAGIFENDRIESRVMAGPRTKACVLSPSSTQVYAMPGGGEAHSEQHIQIKENGCLSLVPKWTVLHKGARFVQSTHIDIDPDSSLFYLDLISAGRLAFGEFMEYDQLASSTEVRIGGKLQLKETFRCGKGANRWIWKLDGEEASHLGNAYILAPGIASHLEESLSKEVPFGDLPCRFAWTPLTSNFVIARMLGSSALNVQKCLELVCRLLPQGQFSSAISQRIG